jgi:alkanesulfonate monooxygenase SsuD/methylene tetrahydromethanopterin reductase-like flavin-dependent oxidoreductase (luciferase family)
MCARRAPGLHFGVGDFSGQRPPDSSVAHRQLYAELLEQAEQIEAAGLDSMWLSEHHFAEDGYMPAVLPIAAALLARTSRITVATDRLAASLHDPIRLAEDAIALDLLSGGRFVLGLSLCYRREEFEGFGVDPGADTEKLEALVPVLREAFAGRAASVAGRRVDITPPPYAELGPRLMIAADGVHGATRAAALADMLMVDPTEPWQVVDAAVAGFDRERGNDQGELVLFAYGGLSDRGREAAWAEVAAGFRYMRHNYDRWMGREPTAVLPPAHYRLLLGTPAEVAEQAAEYRRRYGERVHIVLRCNYPGMSAEAVASQLRLWGRAAVLARSG